MRTSFLSVSQTHRMQCVFCAVRDAFPVSGFSVSIAVRECGYGFLQAVPGAGGGGCTPESAERMRDATGSKHLTNDAAVA